jgi:hypothetical protein
MRLIFTKLPGKLDRLEIVRDDGGRMVMDQPKQRIIPHDMVHFVVEDSMRDGFLDRTARGAPAGFTVDAVADEAEPVERLVEVIQAEAWSAPASPEDVIETYKLTCAARGHEPAPVTPAMVRAMLDRMIELQLAWDEVPVGGSLELVHGR